MKLQFTNQPYQDAAVAGVMDLFHGEGDVARKYVREKSMLLDSVGNALPIPVETIQANLHAIQRRNHLPLTDDADRMAFCVEMETGTGKTYVYVKTIYELNARYGFTKFVVVVPSIAIREGVKKFLEISDEHFQNQYNRPIHWFVYNSARLSDITAYTQSTHIEVMIINIDAFRKSENIIHQPMDRMNGARAIDLIATLNPVVIIDEPQSVDNTPKAKEAISWLNPLVTLRYSATHREKINTVYRLTPVDAYQEGLVKQISVSSIAALDGFNQPYIRLVEVSNDKGYKARVELDVKAKTGKIARAVKTVGVNDDLFVVSGEREMYRDWRISDIDCRPGGERIELSNTHPLALGQTMGDVSEKEVKRGQIRRAIEIHLDKELRLLPRGIKVLTLFFIDQVSRYRVATTSNDQGEYAAMFEEEYTRLIAMEKYQPIRDALPFSPNAEKAHQGYFSVDKKGNLKDTRGDTVDDQDTYALIMRDKERLLSLDEPLRFIFSHSALKEGWDNPNVFQVCTLLDHSSALSARQKIGRGLRLCVNQQGERIYDRQLNTLHVIASEHFAEFADNLQREIEQETGIKFGTLDIETFLHIDVPLEAAEQLGLPLPSPAPAAPTTFAAAPETTGEAPGEVSEEIESDSFTSAETSSPSVSSISGESETPAFPATADAPAASVKLGDAGARQLLAVLQQQGVIDHKGKIKPEAREQIEQGKLELPPAYQPIANPIIAQIRAANRKIVPRDASKEIKVRLKKEVLASPEFLAIWERIKHKTRYRVRFKERKLLYHAADRLAKMGAIHNARIVERNAKVDVQRSGVVATETFSRNVATIQDEAPRPDVLSILREELRLRKETLRDIIMNSGRLDDYITNPGKFLEYAVPILRECKAAMIADGIKYHRLAGQEYVYQEIFDKEELLAYLDNYTVPVEHSVYDHVVVDTPGTERRFAEALDADPDVKLFFKLPDNFKIDTPLGGYNPDWAVLVDTPEARRLYFVLETKGSKWDFDRRETENIKVQCGREHFKELGEVAYTDAEDWSSAKLALCCTR